MTGLTRETLSTAIHNGLRDEIRAGEIKPGERLWPEAVAERYGASIIPVREALRSLEADGLVISRPNRGVFVRTLSTDELGNILVVRKALEELAVREAMDKVTDEVLDEMEALNRDVLPRTIGQEWLEANQEFHFRLYRLSDNATLLQLIAQLWLTMDPYLQVFRSSTTNYSRSLEEHARLLEAVRRGEVEAAVAVAREHIQTAGEIVRRVLAGQDGMPDGVTLAARTADGAA